MVSKKLIKYFHQQHMIVYDKICLLDNRTMYFDIDLHKYVKMNIAIYKHTPRMITFNNLTRIRKCKELVYKAMQEDYIKEKITLITKNCATITSILKIIT